MGALQGARLVGARGLTPAGICSYFVRMTDVLKMMTRWNGLPELLAAMRARADAGGNVVLSPTTARVLVTMLEKPRPRQPGRWNIDLYKEGSCIYQLDAAGEIFQIDGWARNAIVAHSALDALKSQYPERKFSQRRGGWVEGG